MRRAPGSPPLVRFVRPHLAPPPAPGPRYVFVPGYWRWDGGRYVWASGQWQLRPAGFTHWVPGHWHVGRFGRWHWIPGHWA